MVSFKIAANAESKAVRSSEKELAEVTDQPPDPVPIGGFSCTDDDGDRIPELTPVAPNTGVSEDWF